MFFKEYNGWELAGAKTVTMRCENCGNTAEHFVYVAPSGPQLGIVFLRKPLLGARKYFLTCRVCGLLAKELTKAQAEAMKG